MKLTSRDQTMIGMISRYGMMSTTQIRTRFFPNSSLSATRRRLRKLEAKNYLRRITGHEDGLLGWAVTLNSAKAFDFKTIKTRFNKNALDHDLAISELRQRMETAFKIHHWINEHYLKSATPKRQNGFRKTADSVPDSLISIETNAGIRIIALEMELSRKSKSRYFRIFERYAQRTNVNWIWYIVENEGLGKTILVLWNEFRGRSPALQKMNLGYSLLAAATDDLRSAYFVQSSSQIPIGRIFVANDLLGVSPVVPKGNNPHAAESKSDQA
jgi:hypothetical protein